MWIVLDNGEIVKSLQWFIYQVGDRRYIMGGQNLNEQHFVQDEDVNIWKLIVRNYLKIDFWFTNEFNSYALFRITENIINSFDDPEKINVYYRSQNNDLLFLDTIIIDPDYRQTYLESEYR